MAGCRAIEELQAHAPAHARAGETLDLDWTAVARSDATPAIYMGLAAAGCVASNLIAAGPAPAIPVMVAVNVSLLSERLISGRLDALAFSSKRSATPIPPCS